MRQALRVAIVASIAAIVIACSSDETSSPVSNTVDSGGGGGDSSTNSQDGATPDSNSDSSTTPDSSADADAAVAFAVTSSAFADGASIPAQHTCNGVNESPPLAWTAGPAGTLSYAVVLTDLSNMLVHSVIYDIPTSVVGLPVQLPAGVQKVYAPADPAGAHQTKAGFGGSTGYAGPCPGSEHTYEFKVYALDAATLPGLDMSSTAPQGVSEIQQHDLASTALQGKYMQP